MQRELLVSRTTLMDAFDCCEFLCVCVCMRAPLLICCTLHVCLQIKLPLRTVKKAYIMHPQRNRMCIKPNLFS